MAHKYIPTRSGPTPSPRPLYRTPAPASIPGRKALPVHSDPTPARDLSTHPHRPSHPPEPMQWHAA